MSDIFADASDEAEFPEILPVRKFSARIVGVFAVPEGSRVESVAVETLQLDLEGPAGDRHYGFSRKSTSREPWYPRGTVISNTRQLSLLSVEELAEVARRLRIPELRPEWIGASILVEGVPNFSFLPLGTRFHVPGGAALIVTEQNGPCQISGRAIAAHFPGRSDLELGFPARARRRRGILAAVERPGTVSAGDTVAIRLPEQWIYQA